MSCDGHMRAVSAASPMPSLRQLSPMRQKFWQHQQAASRGREKGQVMQMRASRRMFKQDW